MVFQASGKISGNGSKGADFRDLELVKKAEDRSMRDQHKAEKNAKRSLASTEHNFQAYEEKTIAGLLEKLEEEYKLEEKKVLSKAKTIKAEGDTEAEMLKSEVSQRTADAAAYIVKAVITG